MDSLPCEPNQLPPVSPCMQTAQISGPSIIPPQRPLCAGICLDSPLPTELEDQGIDLLGLFGADQMACVQNLDSNVWNVLDERRGFGRIAHQIVPFPKHHQQGNLNTLSLFGLYRQRRYLDRPKPGHNQTEPFPKLLSQLGIIAARPGRHPRRAAVQSPRMPARRVLEAVLHNSQRIVPQSFESSKASFPATGVLELERDLQGISEPRAGRDYPTGVKVPYPQGVSNMEPSRLASLPRSVSHRLTYD